MMKRIFAFCMILVLTVSLITALPVSAASDSDIQLLIDLGIVELAEETGLLPKGYTRSDFARSLCIMSKNDNGLPVSEEEAAAYASDIVGNSNCNFIVAVLAAGYMKTDSEGRFNPAASVSQEDAVTALVKLLGYEPMVQANGGTYEDYYAVALKIDLMRGVSVENSEKLTAEETAEILTNAMDAHLFLPDNIDYGENCLWDRWNIYKYSGKILANSNMGLLEDRTDSNHINIDGKIYYTELLIENELIGSNVTYYTMYGDMGDEVVSIYVKDYGDTITLKPHEITSVSDNGNILTIKTNEKKSLKIDKRGYLIVNGKAQSPSITMFNAFESGMVTFVDSDNNGTYDVVHMTLLFQSILDGVNPDKETLATRYDNQVINLEKIDNYEVYLGKKSAKLSDLSPGMPVGIACDSFTFDEEGELVLNFTNAEYLWIYASSRQSTGYVTAMLGDDKFEIDEVTEYYGSGYNRLTEGGYISTLQVGDYVTAYYDNLGYMTYFEISDSSESLQYGYLIKAGVDGALSKVTQIMVLEINGDFSIYSTDKNFILDGKRVQSGSVVYTVNEEADVDLTKRQVIRYRVSDGVLKEIDTEVVRSGYENEATTLSKEFDRSVEVRANTIDRKYAFESDCILFIDEADIDDTDPSEKLFSVKNASSLGKTDCHLAGYDANDIAALSCVVRYDSRGQDAEGATKSLNYHAYYCYVVGDVVNSINESGDEGWILSLAGHNSKQDYFVPEDNIKLYSYRTKDDWNGEEVTIYRQDESNFTSIIKPGDIIRFTTNSAGDITYIEKLFDFATHKDILSEVPTGQGGQIYGFGKVEKISGNYFIYTDKLNDDTRYISQKGTAHNSCVLYHVESQETELVPFSEIPSAATGNNVKVFIRYYSKAIAYDHIFYIYD